jgi:transcriptional regulator with XRE-family HTH domain
MASGNQIQTAIGARIKRKREQEELSIREVARRTGLTTSFLSLVENGKANVSLDSLRRIAEALEVQRLYFLTEDDEEAHNAGEEQPEAPSESETGDRSPLAKRSYLVIKRNMRPKLTFPESGVTYELLTGRLDRQLEAFIGRLPLAPTMSAGC